MSDDRPQRRPRESLLWPVVIPLGVLAVIGAVLWLFSRVLLGVKPHVATATALVVAIAIVVIVSVAASRKRVGNGALMSVAVGVVGVAMLASGAALLLGTASEEGGGEAVTVALVAPTGAAAKGFQQDTLNAPSDEPFTIEFDNQDTGVQHNVVVASADPQKDPNATTYLTGTPVTGPGQAADPVSALPEGSYYFFCEFHPTTMDGTLTTAPAPEGGTGAPPELSTSISASGLAFDTSTLTFAAKQKTSLEFQNNDTAPHDIAIYTDSSASDALFTGDIVDPGTSTTYDIPALDEGSYFFHCTIHTQMTGTVTVIPAPAGGGGTEGGGGGPPPSGATSSASPSASG
jgi:plastocyanin